MNDYLFRDENLSNLYSKHKIKNIKNCVICNNNIFSKWNRNTVFHAYQCEKCNLIFMNPQLSESGLNDYYANYIGKRRINNKLKMDQRNIQYKQDRDLITKFINKGNLLDVGCNGGFFLDKFSNSFVKYGTEVDKQSVDYAKNNYPFFSDNIFLTNLLNSNFNNNYFDLITMRGVIEHVPDPENHIKKVSDLLNTNGFFFICATPNGTSLCANMFRERWSLFHPIQHLWHYSPENLEILCLKFSLKLIYKEFPYLGTPYETVLEDIKVLYEEINLRTIKISPPFFENMMSLVFQKI